MNKPGLYIIALRLAVALTITLMTSCTGPGIEPVRYQTASLASERSTGPVAELHRKAISAIAQGYYAQSVEYLQRAIKIEPRNAFSWHYLAQTYWHSQQFRRCLEMIKRSISYSSSIDDLDRANAALLSQCEET